MYAAAGGVGRPARTVGRAEQRGQNGVLVFVGILDGLHVVHGTWEAKNALCGCAGMWLLLARVWLCEDL